ncbi:hypothetical protein HMPREF0185_01616 [Brevundimonas diminuta 470-4]|nr:hypothetical protein HMPREF0185_01616 [Brevundimonas diminuta 470-4]
MPVTAGDLSSRLFQRNPPGADIEIEPASRRSTSLPKRHSCAVAWISRHALNIDIFRNSAAQSTSARFFCPLIR